MAKTPKTPEQKQYEAIDLTVFDDPGHKMIAPIDPPDEHRTFDELIESLHASLHLNERAATEIYTLPLHDALPIYP